MTPKKINKDNVLEACQELFEHIKKGHTVLAICGRWNWDCNKLLGAIKKYPELKEAIKAGNNAKRYALEQSYLEYLDGKIDPEGGKAFTVLTKLLQGSFSSSVSDEKSIEEALMLEEAETHAQVVELKRTQEDRMKDSKAEFKNRLELSDKLEKMLGNNQ